MTLAAVIFWGVQALWDWPAPLCGWKSGVLLHQEKAELKTFLGLVREFTYNAGDLSLIPGFGR